MFQLINATNLANAGTDAEYRSAVETANVAEFSDHEMIEMACLFAGRLPPADQFWLKLQGALNVARSNIDGSVAVPAPAAAPTHHESHAHAAPAHHEPHAPAAKKGHNVS